LKIVLIRHAKAEKKAGFDGPEPLRPLTLAGLRQAKRLARDLGGLAVDRVVSSTALRCRQTVDEIARAIGVPVEVHEELAKGESATKAAERLCALDAGLVVCCTHAELMWDLADELQEAGVDVELPRLAAPKVRGDDEPRRLAVLDMGSTSFHMLVADVTRAGHLRPVSRERTMLRLGAAIARSAHIPEADVERALAAAAEMRAHARAAGAEQLIAVGTAALRDADNGPDLTARIESTLRVPVRLLSGEEEARLIFGAFRRRILLPRGPALGVDLGGGSLELAVGDDHGLLFEQTLRVGVTRMHGELVRRDPMKKREARAIRERVTGQLAPAAAEIAALAPSVCVAAGGTARAFGELAVGLRGLRPARSINELVLPLAELRAITEQLVESSHAERLEMPGMRRRRADLLPTGGLILVAVAELLGLDGYTICDWGLREGVLVDAVGRR
jgi:exopolyphosphatase/guanosine-5'-triphosphate,3'-diphosphate pyrophosphatase